MSMNRDVLIEELRRDEGVRHSAYQDSRGFWTIGVGRLIDARKGGRLSDREIDFLLEADIDRIMAALSQSLPWMADLSDARQRVLTNMAFNLGVGGLLSFRNTLVLVQSGQYLAAADEMLRSRWASQVGMRATRLSAMMKSG
jgi:lysozyme